MRALMVWLPRVALVALGAALTWPQPSDAGTERHVVAYGNIRRDPDAPGFRLMVQRDGGHTSRGILRPRCEDVWYLRYDVRPRSRFAGPPTLTEDGAMLRADVRAGAASVQGARVRVGFVRGGVRITCREAFEDPAGNLWVQSLVVLR